MAVVLAMFALTIAVYAAGLAWAVHRRTTRRSESEAEGLPEDLVGLRHEVAALRAEGRGALRHVAVVRYDAFADTGGHLSWSVALVDDDGDGVLLTSIHGRSEARSYAKSVAGWACEQPLSPEEDQALGAARP